MPQNAKHPCQRRHGCFSVQIHSRCKALASLCSSAVMAVSRTMASRMPSNTSMQLCCLSQAVRMLYATDTPLNVCPSIHVFNSVTLMMAYYRSRIFETPGRRWMRPASAVLCVSIIASTA